MAGQRGMKKNGAHPDTDNDGIDTSEDERKKRAKNFPKKNGKNYDTDNDGVDTSGMTFFKEIKSTMFIMQKSLLPRED
jgi:hypothetical protein